SQIDEYLTLINQVNPLEPDYIPPDLTDTKDTRSGRETQRLRLYPAKAAEALLIEARANGHEDITIISGYRSYASQESIFENNAAELTPIHGREEAERLTAFAIAYPGQSEHQSGLAVDMHSIPIGLSQSFGSQPDGIWLAENAHRFGFIVRYPEGAEHITGIQYEPWHLRYIGRVHAARVYERGITFEEYHELFLR
ncbi:MAG: M15 family metallopeptidase, partial [Oscillospiraceae bacterium]|nr:M15 family metallopeptidase [Oscillospiraceae bacterium]